MSTIIIITPPPTKPTGSGAVAGGEYAADHAYAEARALIDQAEAEDMRVRVVRDE